MIRKPKLQADLTPKEFRDAIAAHAAQLDRWIELSVEAFPSDPAAKADRLKMVRDPKTGYRFFVETYLPHYVKGEASLFHEEVFRKVGAIETERAKTTAWKGVKELFVAPRGSSKSTHLSLGLALYWIMLGKKRYMIEVCDVYGQAALLLEAIKAELTSNPRLAHDFPEATGAGRMWREGEIITKNNIKVDGLGALQKIRGRRHGPYRPDALFLDDLENDENVKSPEQRLKLQNWINRAALKIGPPDGSMDVLYVGTILHFDAVLARFAKSPAWAVTEFRAIMQWPDNMELWDRFEEILHNDTNGAEAATAFYRKNRKAMDKGAVLNWPGVQPLLFLMLERAEDHSAFATEYQNKPISQNNPFGNLVWWVQRKRDLIHFGAIDPSLGKRSKGRDPSAILIGGFDPVEGILDVLEASIRRRLPDLIIADTIALQREYRCLLWFVEAVQFQEFLRTTLMKEAAKAHVPLPALPITPHADKDLRIERLQPPAAAGLIRFNRAHTTLIDQLQQWPNGDHDDGPDCLDMLYQNALVYSKGARPDGGIGAMGGNNTSSTMQGYRL